MKVLIFAPFNFAPSFLGLNMEYLQNEIDAGNDVYYVHCSKSFKSCGFNAYGLKYMCEICTTRLRKNIHYVSGKFNLVKLSEIMKGSDSDFASSKLNGIDFIDLGLKVDNFDLGESVYSSLISKTRERSFVSTSQQEILRELSLNSLTIYNALRRFITENKIGKIILFNGRWDYYRAALAAGRAEGIEEIEVIENLRHNGYYESFGDALPHNINNRKRLVDSHWDSVQDPSKVETAGEFFIRKRSGQRVIDKSYTLDQKQGKLPDGLDESKKLVVIYNSSDDEFAAVGKEYSNPFFRDQLEGILYVVDFYSNHPEYQIVIRVHPNLKGLKREFLDPIYKLKGKSPAVIVVLPEEDIDSYALMMRASKVISFGSTAGMEASYWGKPVILLGKSFYFYSDVAYVPDNVQDIPRLLSGDLDPKPRVQSEKFGYYFLTGGLRTKHYKSTDEGEFLFKDHPLNSFSQTFRLYYKTLKFFKIKN